MSAAQPVEVDLYVWTLDVEEGERVRLARLLSGDEMARAARFVFERDHDRFIVARGRLREILARELGGAPDEVRFSYAAHGKPSLAAGGPRFNLSHSQGIAALGVTGVHEIGVDVEHVRALKEDIAGRFFSQREVAALRAFPVSAQTEAFFRCWTRKEAIVKAIGDGLSHPLDSFDVSLSEPAVVERFDGEADAGAWRLSHFAAAPEYLGAVASRTGGAPLIVRRREIP